MLLMNIGVYNHGLSSAREKPLFLFLFSLYMLYILRLSFNFFGIFTIFVFFFGCNAHNFRQEPTISEKLKW